MSIHRKLPLAPCLALVLLVPMSLAATAQVVGPDVQIQGFEKPAEDTVVPEFGTPSVKYPYNSEDLETADSLLRRYDSNRDGNIDATESVRARWTRGNPFELDFNRDGQVNRIELAQREALQRLERMRHSNNFFSLLKTREPRLVPSTEELSFRSRGDSQQSDRTSRYMTSTIIQRYDRNRDRVLDTWEQQGLGIDVSKVDENGDGKIGFGELDAWLHLQMQELSEDYSELLPDWFFERDVNKDGQIEMSEFATDWTAELVDEFAAMDTNGDGLLTTPEMLGAKSVVGGVFENPKAEMIPPRGNVLAEIEIEESLIIGKLEVELSITHTYTEHLDAYLLSPSGERVELFSKVGRSDDNFEETKFSDESREKIREGRAPFHGTYQPQAIEKRQPGLSQFEGQELQGVWQLMIGAERSDRFGMLHNWSLIVTPAKESSDE
ncbi:proprotein convertase P-domain-containing protein [Aureliella helgolandensis]|uniref:EF hand n=1 Tax=Aureliella helgolandensis TaxID=2527968 RepID=A0A518G9B7_9BACT|nr:proprotein convertase P-domain-containing protein [Aureliella helgolandensis]QDV25172.1 EF hand [Aureliella helgolandensis]